MNDELPQGWALAHLNDLAKVEWGNTVLQILYAYWLSAFSASGKTGFSLHQVTRGPAVICLLLEHDVKCFLASGKWTAIKNWYLSRRPHTCRSQVLCFVSTTRAGGVFLGLANRL